MKISEDLQQDSNPELADSNKKSIIITNRSNSEADGSKSVILKSQSSQNLAKSLNRREFSQTIQTKLIEVNPEYLNINQNIPNFIQFWKNYFPAVINPHFAMNAMHTIGIGTNKSPIQISSKVSQIKLNFGLINDTIKTLNQITQQGEFDDVFLQVYTHSVVILSPIDEQFSVIIDPHGKLRYKKQIRENSNIHVNPVIKPRSWGNSYRTLHENLIFMENDLGGCVFIKNNDSSALSNKLKKLKEKYASYFSLSELQEIFEVLSIVCEKNLKSIENEKTNSNSLIIEFTPGMAIFNPKFDKKKSKWKLYLAARESDN
ncbi:hypothetical protein [Candidatus Lokiarchaeum ossiferum]